MQSELLVIMSLVIASCTLLISSFNHFSNELETKVT